MITVTARTSAIPSTRVELVNENFHGISVADPYRWLEGDPNDPAGPGRVTAEVAAWTDEQNAYTRAVLDRAPGRAEIEARLRPLMEVGAVTAPAMRGTRYFFSKREGRQNQPVIYWRDGHGGVDRVLIDPAAIDPSGLTTVEWISPSPGGDVVAYGTSRSGDENTTLRLMDVDTGSVRALEISGRTQAPDWLPDGGGFVYRNLRDAANPYSGQVRFHRIGTDPADDALLFRQFTPDEDAKLATTWGPFCHLSHDGRWLLLGYWIDTASTDVWLLDFERFRRTGALDKLTVTVGATGRAVGTVIDGTLYLQTTIGAPNGRIVAVEAASPSRERWRDLVPERDNAVIEAVAFGKGVCAVTYLERASSGVEVFSLSGQSLGRVAQPGIGTSAITTEEDRTEAYLTFTSFNHPTSIFRVDLAAPAAAPELWARPEVPVDPSTVDVRQVWYASKDGTRISMF